MSHAQRVIASVAFDSFAVFLSFSITQAQDDWGLLKTQPPSWGYGLALCDSAANALDLCIFTWTTVRVSFGVFNQEYVRQETSVIFVAVALLFKTLQYAVARSLFSIIHFYNYAVISQNTDENAFEYLIYNNIIYWPSVAIALGLGAYIIRWNQVL